MSSRVAVFDRGPLALGVVALPRIILEFALLAEVSSANPSEERVRTAGCALFILWLSIHIQHRVCMGGPFECGSYSCVGMK